VRAASHSREGIIELMPYQMRQGYHIKYVTFPLTGSRRSLQVMMAFGLQWRLLAWPRIDRRTA
jgi:hypothetical protein